ncbi:4-hydroxy-3-polyprenylbenzoate decarboxylase [Sphingobacterium allocomposti]|uniref:4-hydroxy-3-polyprenylbenzoate decarboxylase n=1 Tax=Sphingobacterium allocomposti TaxID=415956 RepID=A0A5S5DP29_9SPHI|nr:UbiD family decarboxylase [Sphingobacterium composti Yoo et al. 2007 non Ten et al. 2007]TYP97667.1 4-hydroxy-3-polyprenylbenzoate decarboxylase [Sphingobacterium composti Yoo et al. 2007 non Ten et al. 2007]
MGYKSLAACVADLERHGHLVRIKEEVDPYLEMAAIHMRVFDVEGPALFFENIKGSRFPAVSNLFGTLDRSKFMFRDTLDHVKRLVDVKMDPLSVLKKPLTYAGSSMVALGALPWRRKAGAPILYGRTKISELPQIVNWPMDGGAFVTMPQVYTEDVTRPGIMKANLGMYRIQLSGNDYVQNEEIGLHYQLHRGIGVHQTRANAAGKPLKVSVFVGGPPAHPLSAVMPLPEGLSEAIFAGALGNRRFRYFYDEEGFCISADADFVITGTVYPQENKPEGPFGDHIGYYSLVHPFPLMKVHKVYHRKDPIWSFTVVGRPPQEDTSFGALIHEITGSAIPQQINGLHSVHAVDAAGVHPLLFAIGSERYTPYQRISRPQEVLTIANQILGTNQLSLAKYLFISAYQDDPSLDIHDIPAFLTHILERIDLSRDLHFMTNTTIDTLDYSGDGLNTGSKVVLAAVGDKKRELRRELSGGWALPRPFAQGKLILPGIVVVDGRPFTGYDEEASVIASWAASLDKGALDGLQMIVLVDDAHFAAASINNFVWVTFTRSNPSHDIHGVDSFITFKHWGCNGPLIIDARRKPHHAPDLVKDESVERKVDRLGAKGGSLYGII